MRRLNWGCGGWTPATWINSDIKAGPGVDLVCDIRRGLPLPSDYVEYVVSIHALPELAVPELLPALTELRRVLKPGGVLRLGLPDLDRAIGAYRERDRTYFVIPDDHGRSLGSKLILQMLWYGYSRSLFTFDFTAELLESAGYCDVSRCGFRETKSQFGDIVELDNRPGESFFVEARKPREEDS